MDRRGRFLKECNKYTEVKIDAFINEFSWLSNFYPCDIYYDKLKFPSVENAYQAAKTLDRNTRKLFKTISPSQAKKLGSSIQLRPDWEKVKLEVMEKLLRIKFQYVELAEQLIDTEDAELIEGNWWGDTFWGVCNGKGKNHLGKLLMKIREEL